MSNEMNKNTSEVEETSVVVAQSTKLEKKAKKPSQQKDNFFKRVWKKIVKLCKDTVGEMKKVVWTPKAELFKNTKLVVITVVAIAVAVAVIDTAFSYLINTVAGLIG